jgi:glycosyltransferase involved in cell wall biosynthesis
MRSPAAIAERILEALENRSHLDGVRKQARQTVLERYDVRKLLPQQLEVLRSVTRK